MHETMQKTTFGKIIPEQVNLERALHLNERLGGHFVTGHVDTMSDVAAIRTWDGYELRIALAPAFAPLVIMKGSVCVDGVSLTVARVASDSFSIALIPHTLSHTTLGQLTVGGSVNLEFDMVGKYIARIMEARQDHANG
jgi:riboflavin synthase